MYSHPIGSPDSVVYTTSSLALFLEVWLIGLWVVTHRSSRGVDMNMSHSIYKKTACIKQTVFCRTAPVDY